MTYASAVRARGPAAGIVLLSVAVLAAAMSGCRRVPRKEIERARLDIADAIHAQAPTYAPSSFQEANRALEGARRLVSEKRYSDARTLAQEASSLARSAVGTSADNRQKMLVVLRVKVEATDRKLADAGDEIKVAEARAIDANIRELFGAEMIEARTKQEEARRRMRDQDLVRGKKWADDADIAAETLLRDIRFEITRKQSEQIPRKTRRKSRG